MSDLDDRVGALLIQKLLINKHQLTKALEFQAKLNERNYMPLGEIMIQLGFISRSNLVEVLKEQTNMRKAVEQVSPPPPPPTTTVPANFKLSIIKPNLNSSNLNITNKNNQTQNSVQVAEENINWNGPKISNKIYSEKAKHKPIGEILVEKGFINREQLTQALQYQSVLPPTHYKPIGEIMVELKYVTREQLNTALGIQPPVSNNSLGEILKQLGMIDASQLAIVLMQQHSIGGKYVPVGELLVQHGFISKEQLNQALEEQKKRNNKTNL